MTDEISKTAMLEDASSILEMLNDMVVEVMPARFVSTDLNDIDSTDSYGSSDFTTAVGMGRARTWLHKRYHLVGRAPPVCPMGYAVSVRNRFQIP